MPNFESKFSNLSERFRHCKTRQQFDKACQYAGQVVWQAIDAGLLKAPIDWPKPQFNPGDPTQLAWQYQSSWFIFVTCWEKQHPNEVPPIPLALKWEQVESGSWKADAFDWEASAGHLAVICDWLSEKLEQQPKQRGKRAKFLNETLEQHTEEWGRYKKWCKTQGKRHTTKGFIQWGGDSEECIAAKTPGEAERMNKAIANQKRQTR